jgi:hypothetical protein
MPPLLSLILFSPQYYASAFSLIFSHCQFHAFDYCYAIYYTLSLRAATPESFASADTPLADYCTAPPRIAEILRLADAAAFTIIFAAIAACLFLVGSRPRYHRSPLSNALHSVSITPYFASFLRHNSRPR